MIHFVKYLEKKGTFYLQNWNKFHGIMARFHYVFSLQSEVFQKHIWAWASPHESKIMIYTPGYNFQIEEVLHIVHSLSIPTDKDGLV